MGVLPKQIVQEHCESKAHEAPWAYVRLVAVGPTETQTGPTAVSDGDFVNIKNC